MGRRAGAVSSAAQECVAAGDFYQALQVYHGLCSRAKLAGDVEGKETSAETIALWPLPLAMCSGVTPVFLGWSTMACTARSTRTVSM